ncbi:hypothetical protein GALMADRAFT_1119041 [Galerina marginata CBS 339.88]|uniref:F-box domain-containing protein n=1 Tax=Galerina marginata (strain CBS 339.88) TaxID=685588 RepID=A0A067TCT3_GALM3|nr:hypothetical protein GALMADRAFT_1119041 [Galerina marginata CBS 339.88]
MLPSFGCTPIPPAPSPLLPAELVGLILETTLATTDIATISSLALVSHSFRMYANSNRFSMIFLNPEESKIISLRRLIDLEMSIPTMHNVRVTSFIIYLDVDIHVSASAELYASLAIIMRNLFRSPTNRLGRPSDSSRRFAFSYVEEDHTLEWHNIDSDFMSAFHNLCRNSALTTLELKNIRNIPRGLLKGSTIKHLTYESLDPPVNPGKSRPSEVCDEGPILIESLTTDHVFSFFEILNDPPLSPRLACSRLKRLQSELWHDEKSFIGTAEILAVAESLEWLKLCYYGEAPSSQAPFEFGHLSKLDTLVIGYCGPPEDHYPNGISRTLIDLLVFDVPPALSNIVFDVSGCENIELPRGMAIVEDIVEHIYLELTINSSVGRNVDEELDLESLREKANAYMLKFVKPLGSGTRLKLLFQMTIF